jgi:dehydrogluconokinase
MALLVAGDPGPLDAVGSYAKRTAGAETNVAIGLARLGLRVGWISRLGEDSWGRYLHRTFVAEGIDCSRVSWDAGASTGMMIKEYVTDGHDPEIEYHRRGSAASRLGPQELDTGYLLSARHLHVTGVYPGVSSSCHAACERAIRVMREAGRTVSFDPNLRPTLWPSRAVMVERLNALAVQCDWVLPGQEEGRVLCGSDDPSAIARFYLDRGVKQVIVKLGPQGAWWATPEASGQVAAFPVDRVVDTVGAGDGFAVGVISALLQGRALPDAVRRGTWIGARAVQVRGDTEGLPTAAELVVAGV